MLACILLELGLAGLTSDDADSTEPSTVMLSALRSALNVVWPGLEPLRRDWGPHHRVSPRPLLRDEVQHTVCLSPIDSCSNTQIMRAGLHDKVRYAPCISTNIGRLELMNVSQAAMLRFVVGL